VSRGGHNKEPANIHVLRGTVHPRQNKAHPQPRPGRPTCPGWLLPEAKAEWRRVVPELLRLGVLAAIDRAALAAYCEAWARWCECEAVIGREGATVPGHRGVLRKHPLLPALHAYAAMVKAFGQEFGLTPASRGRLSVAPPRKADPFDDFLRGGHDGN
jgi:P27 family predicted phage terminase small subunit